MLPDVERSRIGRLDQKVFLELNRVERCRVGVLGLIEAVRADDGLDERTRPGSVQCPAMAASAPIERVQRLSSVASLGQKAIELPEPEPR